MPPERLFDYLSVRLNGERAAGKVLRINVDYTDLKKGYGLRVQNAVPHYSTIQESQPQASVQPPSGSTSSRPDRHQDGVSTPKDLRIARSLSGLRVT